MAIRIHGYRKRTCAIPANNGSSYPREIVIRCRRSCASHNRAYDPFTDSASTSRRNPGGLVHDLICKDKAMIVRMIGQTIASYILFGLCLFAPAGTLKWSAAWVFLAEMLLLTLTSGLWLSRHDPALLKERLRAPVQGCQTTADKIFVAILLVLFPGWLILMGFDAGRFHWSHMPMFTETIGIIALIFAVGLGFC
ncbi:MAG: hypothetical protein ACYDC6_02330 [Acidobacteriaceae bacterium]